MQPSFKKQVQCRQAELGPVVVRTEPQRESRMITVEYDKGRATYVDRLGGDKGGVDGRVP
jgi:hypothetical protein